MTILRLACLCLLALLPPACAGPAVETSTDTLIGIAPRYEPSFQAVRSALDDRDDVTAEAILRKLRTQLELESTLGEGDVAAEADSALKLANGFQRIVEGRRRLRALDLSLVLEPAEDGSSDQDLVLLVKNSWETTLRLVPGPVSLVLSRTRVSAAGRQARVSRAQALDPLEVEVSPQATARVVLGRFGSRLSNDTLAERQLYVLELRAGEVIQGSASYPAQGFDVQPAEFVGLAHFLPNTPVEPKELFSYLQRAQPKVAPVMERAIRILPSRRSEALGMLMPLVQRATEAEFQRIAPALQWLAPEGPEVSGRERWLQWLEQSTGQV